MQAYKKFIAKSNEVLCRIIPILALVLGGVLGVGCYFAFPTIIIAENWYMAIIVGAASGLSATGCNQIFKQLKKFGIDVKEVDSSNTGNMTNEKTLDDAKHANISQTTAEDFIENSSIQPTIDNKNNQNNQN